MTIYALTNNQRVTRIANWFDIGRAYNRQSLLFMPVEMHVRANCKSVCKYISMIPFKIPNYLLHKLTDQMEDFHVWPQQLIEDLRAACLLYAPNIRIYRYGIDIGYIHGFFENNCIHALQLLIMFNVPYRRRIIRVILFAYMREMKKYKVRYSIWDPINAFYARINDDIKNELERDIKYTARKIRNL
jgi:hypothetical protein